MDQVIIKIKIVQQIWIKKLKVVFQIQKSWSFFWMASVTTRIRT